MLVLSRKSGETIRIGDDIVVTITEIRGGRVKIGISAPDSCSIRRGELQDWREEPAPLAAQQLAANERRSATPAKSSRKAASAGRAVSAVSSTDSKNRLRLTMETPLHQFIAH